jgi:phospholipase C
MGLSDDTSCQKGFLPGDPIFRGRTMATINHIFVLMMENRSFDHLLGFSGLPGVDPPDASWGMTPDAPDRPVLDPNHEFEDVAAQIAGVPPMSGFSRQPYWSASRQGFTPKGLPVLSALAGQYFLFDNWYSSMPGPTWPNRFFVHAGSSGGLDNSPSGATAIEAATIDALSFSFTNDTLYQRLDKTPAVSWRVYHDDLFPQVLAIKHMLDPFRLNTDQFRSVSQRFADDLSDPRYSPSYTFIEPDYGFAGGLFGNGNSQHPKGSIARGEAFIKFVYDCISQSPIWSQSLLLVTYDEHGGFFDSEVPPKATPPGDGTQNHKRAEHPQNFAFDKYGVRVPAIAISPWISPGGLGSQKFADQIFDHTSVIRTVLEVLNIGGNLTERDKVAPSFASICSLDEARTDLPQISPPVQPAAADPQTSLVEADPTAPPESMAKGFSRIAMSLDLRMSQDHALPPIAAVHPAFTAAVASAPSVLDSAEAASPAAFPVAIAQPSNQQMLAYIRAVAERVNRLRSGISPTGGPM